MPQPIFDLEDFKNKPIAILCGVRRLNDYLDAFQESGLATIGSSDRYTLILRAKNVGNACLVYCDEPSQWSDAGVNPFEDPGVHIVSSHQAVRHGCTVFPVECFPLENMSSSIVDLDSGALIDILNT